MKAISPTSPAGQEAMSKMADLAAFNSKPCKEIDHFGLIRRDCAKMCSSLGGGRSITQKAGGSVHVVDDPCCRCLSKFSQHAHDARIEALAN
jgi:hypothetical protein